MAPEEEEHEEEVARDSLCTRVSGQRDSTASQVSLNHIYWAEASPLDFIFICQQFPFFFELKWISISQSPQLRSLSHLICDAIHLNRTLKVLRFLLKFGNAVHIKELQTEEFEWRCPLLNSGPLRSNIAISGHRNHSMLSVSFPRTSQLHLRFIIISHALCRGRFN